MLTATTIGPFSALAALLPALFFTVVVYWADRYEKEPWWLLSATFLWGAVPSILIALFTNAVLSAPFYYLVDQQAANTLAAVTIAPLVEETAKALVLVLIFFRWRQEIDSPLDGIIYGAMVGIGFAMVENIFYYIAIYQQGGAEAWGGAIFLRGFVFGLNHALYGAITGLGIAIARMSSDRAVRVLAPLLGWATAVFLHALHNLVVSLGSPLALLGALALDWAGVLVVALIVVWAVWQEGRWIREYLADEISIDGVSRSEYAVASSAWRRSGYRLRLLASHGPRAYWRAGRRFHIMSELAYRKHHYSLFGDPPSAEAIERLRSEMTRY
jgi:protease PrsW